MKKKFIFGALGIILLTPLSSTGVVLASTLTYQKSVVVNNNVSVRSDCMVGDIKGS